MFNVDHSFFCECSQCNPNKYSPLPDIGAISFTDKDGYYHSLTHIYYIEQIWNVVYNVSIGGMICGFNTYMSLRKWNKMALESVKKET